VMLQTKRARFVSNFRYEILLILGLDFCVIKIVFH
jgi:hypothetical protein